MKNVVRMLLLALSGFVANLGLAEEVTVFFGTYTKGDSKGIYRSAWNPEEGTLSEPELAAEIENPSFLTIGPTGEFLYSVSEISDFKGGGAVNSFRILETGDLELLNRQPTGGGGPCHLALTSDGKILATANYGGGSVASYRIEDDGSLSNPVSIIQHEGSSVNPKRQTAPHAHSINFSPDDRFAYAADLGTDRIYIYAVDGETGGLTSAGEVVVSPGSGPRHFAFHPSGKFAYVIHELTLTMEAFSVHTETGALKSIGSACTLPPDTDPVGSTAEVVCHPGGKFLYGSNRGHDSIVVFSIDPSDGTMNYVENESIQGEVPRNFALSPQGDFLFAAGQKSNSVAVFSVDPSSGELEFTDTKITVPVPVCVRFLER